jgi:basic amino acid/polyamine antiporter, APA family
MQHPSLDETKARPRRHVSTAYVTTLAIGLVVGAGIFKAPAYVAANAGSADWLFAAWLIGGALTLIGALCYAELALAFPDSGGDYHFLKLAFGPTIAFLFAWGRLTVINTGAMALLAFALGDYANEFWPLGANGSALYAWAAIAALTLYNLRGAFAAKSGDFAATGLEVAGVLSIGMAGVSVAVLGLPPVTADAAMAPSPAAFGTALVFVLLAFGGWNDIATLSAEVRDSRRGMLVALVTAVVVITLLFVFANWALWRGLGLEGLAQSNAPAIDLARRAFGEVGVTATMIAVALAALTSINAIMIVGARTTHALARDWPALRSLAHWDPSRGAPLRAMIAQSAVAGVLVAFGAVSRGGFSSLVDYTAPVYWLFILLAGLAVIVLRLKLPNAPRPFRTPLFPVLPLLLIASSAFVLWSSLAFVKIGALAGLAILAVGLLSYQLTKTGRK